MKASNGSMTNSILPSKPTPRQLRSKLEEMVVNDLLGPAAGESEELTERNVRDRYVVGVLAPRWQAAPGKPSPTPEEPEEDTPLIPDELSQGGADSMDDGSTDMGVPLPRAHLPSSFGMSFCLVNDAKALRVSAHWGQYLRERKEDELDEKTGLRAADLETPSTGRREGHSTRCRADSPHTGR